MPRGFNDYERQAISNSLIEQGRILFSRFGLRKTSINEITKKVGIAPGTFYKFYSSKEDLFFEILEKEEEQIKEQFFSIDLHNEKHTKKTIKDFLHCMINIIQTNPLIRQMYFENTMQDLLRKLPQERLEKHFNNDASALMIFIEKWKMEGILLEENPEVIAGIFRSLFVLTLHQKEIGENVYQIIIELFINLIVDFLVKESCGNMSSYQNE